MTTPDDPYGPPPEQPPAHPERSLGPPPGSAGQPPGATRGFASGGSHRDYASPADTIGTGDDGAAVPPARRRWSKARWIAIAIGGAAVVALAAGVAFAVSALRGGGPQPEEFVPADA